MISRRNIRVKVMQTLYTWSSTGETFTKEEALRTLEKHIDQSRQLFVYLIYVLTEVARYAETDARLRASKHLPNASDLNVNTKLAGNTILWQILELSSYQLVLKEIKPQLTDNGEWIKKIYHDLAETDFYKQYTAAPARDKKAEREILEFIFTDLLLPNEQFIAFTEEQYMHWDDDCEMMNQLMLSFLQKPHAYNFQQFISEDKLNFAKNLLTSVMEKEETCLNYIKQKLHNWDPERTALLDMILMRMGICEFLYFETIPPKVTINEYIDLAKDYSTPQSGHFVNGILDSIHKDLVAGNKLHKVSFKKS